MPNRDSEHRDYENRVPTTEAERIAVAAAKLAGNDVMNETFALIGVARGSVDSVEEFRADLAFVRALRKRPEIWKDFDFLQSARLGSIKAGAKLFMTVFTMATGAAAFWLFNAIKAGMFGK